MRSVPSGPTAVARAPVETQLLEDKIQDVARYIHSHAHTQHSEQVEPSGQLMNLQMDSNSRLVTVMHPAGYPSQVCRQVSLGGEGVLAEGVGGGWVSEELIGAELTEEDGRLAAALVAVHLAHSNSRVTQVRQDVEQTVLMGGNLRLFNNQDMGDNGDPIVVEVPTLPQLPPLQDMSMKDSTWYHTKANKEPLKGTQNREPIVVEVPTLPQLPPLQDMSMKDNSWYHTKTNKEPLKDDHRMIADAERMELRSPAQNKQSRKSLPHKKRISRKLRRAGAGAAGGGSGAGTPRHDAAEEILPDSFRHARPDAVHDDAHHIAHEVRPILICQICGDFYGEEQLKFFHHLKQHYEPQGATIIIENPVGQMQPVGELALDKMSTCIVDNVAPLPEALVELSLESGKMSLYHERHAAYAGAERAPAAAYAAEGGGGGDGGGGGGGERDAYDAYDAREPLYGCTRCNRTFRRQKACEAHIKEAHPNKVDEMSEFSEPEDLMEGIHVLVEGGEGGEVEVATGGGAAGGFLTVEGGHVHQEHIKHWYQLAHAPEAAGAGGGGGGGGEVGGGGGDACAGCSEPTRDVLNQHINHCPMHLKEEVLQRIFESEVDSGNNASLSPAMMIESGEMHESTKHHETADVHRESDGQHQGHEGTDEPRAPKQEAAKEGGKKKKVFECQECQREFKHRNSLLYHLMSHNGLRSHKCTSCDKAFFTPGALKVHERIHNGSKPYKCMHCEKHFRQWGDLKYHVVSLHTAKKNYKCGYCSKEFARKYSLNVHIRIHTGERNYQCDFCNKSFRASSYRLSHMRTHTGERPFSCDVCGKRFRVGGDMRRHQLTHEKSSDDGVKPRRGKKPVLVKLVNIKIRKEPPKTLLVPRARRARHDEQILPDQFGDESPPAAGGSGADVEIRKRLEQDHYRSDAYECDPKLELRPGDSPPRNITPFEHLQKRDASGAHTQIHISDIRSYATKPEDVIPTESLENTFIERLTAMYSIAPIT